MLGIETWVQPWGDEAARPAFHWRHGTVIERALLEAEAAGEHGAGEVAGWTLAAAFAAGLHALLPDDADVPRLIDLNQRDLRREPLDDADAAVLFATRDQLARIWPAYGALVAQQARRDAIVPVLAFRRFVTGWDGVVDGDGQPVPFARGVDGCVTDAAMQAVDPTAILVLGLTINNALWGRLPNMTGGLEKNSAARSKSGSARRTSRAGRRNPAGGSSGRTNGTKTRR